MDMLYTTHHVSDSFIGFDKDVMSLPAWQRVMKYLFCSVYGDKHCQIPSEEFSSPVDGLTSLIE